MCVIGMAGGGTEAGDGVVAGMKTGGKGGGTERGDDGGDECKRSHDAEEGSLSGLTNEEGGRGGGRGIAGREDKRSSFEKCILALVESCRLRPASA